MPVARIYASLVEEAEPICADLLARGYNVEVVFPDAVLPTPADLELRVERCSAEQAIARVEAGGSPSRCVFVTPAKGPRRELLLVEMTVLATGTDGRHPIAMPGIALVPGHVAEMHSPLGKLVPFPSATSEGTVDAAVPAPTAPTPPRRPLRRRARAENGGRQPAADRFPAIAEPRPCVSCCNLYEHTA